MKFVTALYKECMRSELLAWDASSNKQLLSKDAEGQPPDKYAVLADSLDWSTNVGFPGYASAAIDDGYSTWVLNTMVAQAATDALSPEAAVKEAEAKYKKAREKWAERKLI